MNIPLTTWVQAPDVTEILSHGLVNLTEDSLREKVKTEFAWVVTSSAVTGKITIDALERLKFKEISRMSNHYPGHKGQRHHLTFWWKRVHDKSKVLGPIQRTYWCEVDKWTTSGGCGFKMGEPPFKGSLIQLTNFFSLIRIPNTKNVLKYEKIIAKHNFQRVDTGELATFFVNGWRRGWSYEKEMKFFENGGIIELAEETKRRLPNRDKMGRFCLPGRMEVPIARPAR
jgi:hypothetical protein